MTATDLTTTRDANAVGAASGNASIEARILLSVFFFIAAWAGAVVTWGLPGLYIPAVALVPVIWVLLLLITRG